MQTGTGEVQRGPSAALSQAGRVDGAPGMWRDNTRSPYGRTQGPDAIYRHPASAWCRQGRATTEPGRPLRGTSSAQYAAGPLGRPTVTADTLALRRGRLISVGRAAAAGRRRSLQLVASLWGRGVRSQLPPMAYSRVQSRALRMAASSLHFQSSATSLASGSSGLGALSRAWMESSTVRICSAGDHLSAGATHH